METAFKQELITTQSLCSSYNLRETMLDDFRMEHTGGCAAGQCSNDCTKACATCITCPQDCAIKA